MTAYKIFGADQSSWEAILGEDGFETRRLFEEQFFIGGNPGAGFIVGSRNDRNTAKRTKLGEPVKTPGLKNSRLFDAQSTDIPSRHDCVRTRDGKWFCVYTKSEYDAFKIDLAKRHRDDAKAKTAGKTLNPNTKTYDSDEKKAALQAAFQETNRKGQRQSEMLTGKVRGEPEPFEPYETQLKIKDAQQILLNYMDDLVAFQGLPFGGQSYYDEITAYTGDPSGFFNILTSPPSGMASGFVAATPAQLGVLVPKVEFYEVTSNPTEKDPKKKGGNNPYIFS